MLKKLFFTFFLLVITTSFSMAETEMADTMRENGKIYVVIVVLATIFAAIFAYLIVLDRKIAKLENKKTN